MTEPFTEANVESVSSNQPTEIPLDQQPNSTQENSIDVTNVLPSNFTFNGDQIAIDLQDLNDSNQLVGSDGQVYILVQNEKGEYFFSPESDSTLLNQAEGVQISSHTTGTEVHLNDNPDDIEYKSDKTSEDVNLQKDEIHQNTDSVELSQDNVNVASDILVNENQTVVDNLRVVEDALHNEMTNSEFEKQNNLHSEEAIVLDTSVSVPIEKPNNQSDLISKQNNLIEPPNVTSKNENKPLSSRDTTSSVSTKNATNTYNITQDSFGSLLGNFVNNSQLANSPKTYSRPKNIQWITPNLKPNGIDNTDDSIIQKEVLTTTIEIAETSDDFDELSPQKCKEENDPVKINEKVVNNLSNSIEKVQIELNDRKIETNFDSVPTVTEINPNVNIDDEEKRADETSEENILPQSEMTQNNKANDSQPLILNTILESESKQLTDLEESVSHANNITNDVSSTRRGLRDRRSSLKNEVKETKSKFVTEENKKRTRTNEPKEMTKKTNDISLNSLSSQTKLRKNIDFEENDLDVVMLDENDIEAKFKFKDVRDAMFFNDYKVNELHVHIRIQPEERNELKKAKYFCVNCGFESLSIYTNRNHQESCFKYSDSFLHADHTSTKPLGKIEKITYKPLDLNFPPLQIESNCITFNEKYDLSDSDSGNEENSIEPQSLDGFKEKDIVWVNSVEELGPWPALIMKILPDERKLSVKLIEYSAKKKSFKIDVKAAVSYNAGIRDKKIKWQNVELTKACSKADEYVRKRTLSDDTNDSINPDKFFNFTKKFAPLNTPVANNVQSENDRTFSGQVQDQNIQLDSSRISNFIKSGDADNHITSFCNEGKYREYQENVDQYLRSSIFGPVKDEDQQEEIVNRCKAHDKHDNIDFVLNVLVPQAIIKAISKIYQIDKARAERIFDQESTKQPLNVELL